MLFFSHLLAGLTIGILLYWYFRDPILIVASAIGSILPDLIDKPAGILVFGSSIGGRIYLHGLLFFFVVLVIGIAIWWYFHSFSGIALGLGILSHQLLDMMWKKPVNWYYPLLGPYTPVHYTSSFIKGLMSELTNPSEWLFGLVVILILFQVLLNRGFLRHKRLFTIISLVLTGFLALSGTFILYCGWVGSICFFTGWKNPLNNIIAGMVIICVVAVVGILTVWKTQRMK
jgi:hypothetical protein